ncbi:MAG: DUF4388 domain-containing protein [Acidobacteriota bacterium]|nr:DUF4388 domain-containing protein [Acidobacteriota bacterium]MDH3523795.1 DUF4388 domain-containing protein [Acidobacteriota bacterium]
MRPNPTPHPVDLLELADALCRRKSHSVLCLENQGRRGEIHFVAGEIVHASFEGQHAEAALVELLSWKTGDLHLTPLVERPRRTIETDVVSMLFGRNGGSGDGASHQSGDCG